MSLEVFFTIKNFSDFFQYNPIISAQEIVLFTYIQ